jgi:ATP-binding cassette subfamily B protein
MIKIFRNLKRREISLILISIVFIVFQVFLDLRIPGYMSEITVLVQTPGSQVSDIGFTGLLMLLAALGSVVSSVIVGFFAARVAASFSKQLREKIFTKVMTFSLEEIGSFSTPSLITRTTNDVIHVQMVIAMGLQAIIKAPIMATWAMTKIAGKSWQWSATTGVAVLIMTIAFVIISVFAIPKFKIIQRLTDNLNRVTRENLSGIRVVRAYNAEDYQQEKFEDANEELTYNHLFTSRIMAIINPIMTLIMSGLSLVIYWTGAYIINIAPLADRIYIFSDMVVFSAYAMQVIMSFMMLTMIFVMLPRASVSANRINEVLDTKFSIIDGSKEKGESETRGTIRYQNVGFKYPGAADYVLKDISFEARAGETIAIIGSTGSGKSTLVNLLPRLFDITEGKIEIDGVNIKDYKLQALREKLGYVSQEAILFSGNIMSNLTIGSNEKSNIRTEKALEIAQAKEFVSRLDQKEESYVAQGGTNFSGGQKQRLTIARAIYKEPAIFIFDDSFSALDFRTERMLRDALSNNLKNSTSLIVGQRISSIKNADRIIVLEKGKMVGYGSHNELIKDCETYQEIAFSQLSEEELQNAK